MENKSKNFLLTPNKLLALICYVFINFFGGSLILILLIAIFSAIKGCNFDSLYEIMTMAEVEAIPKEYLSTYATIYSISNLLSYSLMAFFIVFYVRDDVVQDFKSFISSRKIILFAIISSLLFYGITYLYSNVIIGNIVGDSENQLAIEAMISNGGAIFMFISVVFLAPIVEELIYRKSIFCLLNDKHVLVSYIVSSLAFAIPHMLTTSFEDPFKWLVLSTTYLLSGILLCLIYHKSKYNVYTTIVVHMVNNLISFILIYG